MESSKKNILIGCTGSVATIKVSRIAETLMASDYNVTIIPTKCSLHFLKCHAGINEKLSQTNPKMFDDIEDEIKYLFPKLYFITESDEWNAWQKKGDPVLHIELRKWADIMLIAPLDANTLAKIANGICDNLLTCIIRAWDLSKPLLYCPAMNTHMYAHPLTSIQLNTLKSFGYKEIKAISKTLMCGDEGLGAMAEVEEIVKEVKYCLENK